MLEFLLIGNLMVGHSHYHISTEEFNSHLIIWKTRKHKGIWYYWAMKWGIWKQHITLI